jgi:hypothetical protein
MHKNEIITRLKSGWELANRGRGWWLSAPRVPYKSSETIMIDDAIVNAMEKEGLITLDLPYTTLFARLAS